MIADDPAMLALYDSNHLLFKRELCTEDDGEPILTGVVCTFRAVNSLGERGVSGVFFVGFGLLHYEKGHAE